MARLRNFPLAIRLLILVIGALAPVLIFSGFLLVRYAQSERAHLDERAHTAARSFAGDIDRELANATRATMLLAVASTRLRTGDLAGFHAQAVEALKVQGFSMVLSDVAGQE